ncbi:hypothetical protein A1OE_1530 [Candidatus Endolissoclinum faulkneri L2]|uniref:Uncharacterized protein n=1 Tax=Candidatus Endolissoclinum faulkneri L2 TaxID=1193729 RepID=K7Z678_9PROT|nr:hypothetical protein A1OE_1530 [Candidatus Endolissoclinum faulkneri L2]
MNNIHKIKIKCFNIVYKTILTNEYNINYFSQKYRVSFHNDYKQIKINYIHLINIQY